MAHQGLRNYAKRFCPVFLMVHHDCSNQVKVLQAELKSAKERLAAAEARLFAEQSAKEHAVEAAKFQIRSEMQGKIEEAYDKGYDRCKNAITDSMKMMQDFKALCLTSPASAQLAHSACELHLNYI